MTSPFGANDFSGFGSMQDPLAFVKNLWGNMQVPGMVTPTVSIEELDKKIQDLKTVETWLNVNMNMLRGTIQAMEVQRATIAALNSLGESFASSVASAQAAGTAASENFKSAMGANAASANTDAKDHVKADSHQFWPHTSATANAADATKSSKTESPFAFTGASAKVETAKETAKEETKEEIKEEIKEDTKSPSEASGSAQSPFSQANAWWNVLQDQFKQAVKNANITPDDWQVKPSSKAGPSTEKAPSEAKVEAKKTSKVKAKSSTTKAASPKVTKPASAAKASETKPTAPRTRKKI